MTDTDKIIIGVLVLLATFCMVAIMLGYLFRAIADQTNPHDDEGEE